MRFRLFLFTTMLLFLGACVREFEDDIDFPKGEVEGLKPIYGDATEIKKIEIQPARVMENPGKIYRKEGFLYINEFSKGVHIIDNTNPGEPLPVAFIKIPGNVDIAAKGDIFYFDNFGDLVAIRITNANKIEVVKRLIDVLPTPSLAPSKTDVYFECVDESKGVVIGWESTTLSNPKCYR